jgi:Fe-S oxidoreductase/nitrate reductase gamma subunit
MPDPALFPIFGLPGYSHLWLLTLISFFVFGNRVVRHVRVLAQARPESRWDNVGQRIGLVVKNVLGQRRMLDEPLIGAAHFIIFWAFVAYATTFFWNLLRGLIPALPIPYPDDVRWVAFVVQALGVLGVIALAVAAVRRYLFTPTSLERSWDATFILLLITVVLVSSLAGAGFKALATTGGESWQPVGRSVAAIFASIGVTRSQAPALFLWTWWVHMITVLGFLAYLPYSKHLHLLASPFGVFFASLEPSKMPSPSEGASRLQEFTWRELFSGLACAECGRCDRTCPSFASGEPLSPKQLIHHVKELVLARGENPAAGNGKRFLGDVVRPEDIWACTTCGSCMERCPVFNEHIPLVIEMRRKLVSEGEVQTRLQEAFTNLSRYGNSFGQSERKRAAWTQNLGFKPKDARKEAVQWLWYVGEYACYHPSLLEITRSLARTLRTAGVDYGLLYEAERNSGNDVRRVGEEGLFELLRQKNTATLQQAHFNNLFTTDPHVYNTLKNEYPDLNHGRHLVSHYTELLASLLEGGQLRVARKLPYRVTYHDPCYLGRYNGVYDAPRAVLKALGVDLKEMPRSRRQSFCCGAGGGRIWMEEIGGAHTRPSESRVREAASLNGVQYLVVACPKDYVMFQDALKTTGLEGKLSVKDIAELAEEAISA